MRLLIVGLFLGLTVVGCAQILSRHGLKLPIWNLEQVMPHIFIAITFLGMETTYRHRAYLGIEMVPDALPLRWRAYYRLTLWLATFGFLVAMVWTSLDVVLFQLEISAVTTMGYPAVVLTLCIPIGAGLAIYRLWQLEILPLLRAIRR
jgi:TRAP-type C4-dicarboxylate transport system permease small subunit